MAYIIDRLCLKFILIGGAVLLCLATKSQGNFSELDKLLTANQQELGKNFAVIVYKNGKALFQKENGDFTIKTKAPIASCSKWLTAALVMTFVDEGKISLDDKVSTYLPIFEQYGKSYLTIRQCLSQQTGIADNQKLIAKIFERRNFETLEDEVNSFAKKEIASNPGTSFFYGNIGLNIAGRVVEVVSKKKFDLLMKQRIFSPLNMKSSSFTPEDGAINPSGGAVSTAADYINFLAMILNKGNYVGKHVLSENAVAQMQMNLTKDIPKKFSPKVAEGYDYGLGEWIQETDKKGNASVLACPGLFGTWPYIDKCRNYACIFFVKTLLGEQKKELYLKLKKAIDSQIPTTCN